MILDARPFPFAELPAVSRQEIADATRLRATVVEIVRLDVIVSALSELVGETLEVTLRRTRAFDPSKTPGEGVAVAFALSDAPSMKGAVLVDLEPALANALLSRALRQRIPRVTDASRAASPSVAGALAALLHAAARRAHVGVPLRVIAAGPAPSLARDLAGAHGPMLTAWVTVSLGGDAFDARVTVPCTDLPSSAGRPLSQAEWLARGDFPISIPLVAGTCAANRTELASLEQGDVFVVPSWLLRANATHDLTGPIALVPARGERGLAGELADPARLVIRTDAVESHPWEIRREAAEVLAMSDQSKPSTLEILEDAPVVVRVELGAVEMKARDWAALGPGDVIALGRKLGDPAILRVAGVEVARGELVQLDGEYGVRILHHGKP